MLRVRFIGTSSGDYEFKPYDLIGEVIKNCTQATFFTIKYECTFDHEPRIDVL